MAEYENVLEVDVREDLRLKKEPFDKIMTAVKSLKPGQTLELHAPFNPVPLHSVLKRRGFTHEAEKLERKHWKVIYRKKEDEINEHN
ncbi:hypothetical protein JNUCC1_00257 [Lentibacillus sp. JNUCC-1]|uniref:DUF2249 domain-containing protein n=1 Tax=Lentibacillus sp. JNUCC-1 TaxID=2654513 RepID=UPI0012E97CE6|nr:DUF2249 domain-containing protein [Lentibacillus sp. JNUCC-1]MUV36455.1 hypothetical protein [Lentibacillus sp. JNUCC-1]